MSERKGLFAALLVVSFAAGRYLFPSPDSGITGLSGEEMARAYSEERITSGSRQRRSNRSDSQNNDRLPPEKVAAAMYQDLLIGDFFEAQHAAFNRLSEMDSSNWREVYLQFGKVTAETGIRHDKIWPNVLIRVGQVAGEEALNLWIDEDPVKHQESIIQAMWGWSMKDPEGAAKFYQQQTDLDPDLRKKLLSRLVGGMALTHPDRLFSFVATLPEEDQNHTVGHSVWNLMRGGGLNRTSQWLDEIQQSNFPDHMKSNSFQQVASAVIKNIGGPGSQSGIEWFQRYQDSPHMSPELIAQAAFGFQNDQALEALDFLKTASGFPALEDSRSNPAGLAPAIMKSAAHDSAQVADWLESNRDSAFFSKAAGLYGSYLRNIGDTEGADKWQALSEE